MSIPTIAIVGRRNVGKSALFNRFIEEDKAIVSDIAGTTRDRTEGIGLWRGQKIKFVDTGGVDIGEKDVIEKEVLKQANFAIKNSDIVLFLVDLRAELMSQEVKIARKLVPHKNKIILVGNKADGPRVRDRAYESQWRALALGDLHPVSAATGVGTGDLLDLIFEKLKIPLNPSDGHRGNGDSPFGKGSGRRPRDLHESINIAIIGRPNVGKSSLLNAILGEERVIVSPIPHTTREPQDTEIIFQDKKIILIDTAGIRKRAKIGPGLEKAGVAKTLEIIKRAQIIFLMLEPLVPLPLQDRHLAALISESSASVIVLVNKWDLLAPKEEQKANKWTTALRQELPTIGFAPIVLISALNKRAVQKLLPLACEIAQKRGKQVTQQEIDDLLPKLILRHKPSRGKGTHHPVLRRVEQTNTNPPEFTVWIGPKQNLHFSYVRFLENRLREYFGFEGTPIKIWVRQEKQ